MTLLQELRLCAWGNCRGEGFFWQIYTEAVSPFFARGYLDITPFPLQDHTGEIEPHTVSLCLPGIGPTVEAFKYLCPFFLTHCHSLICHGDRYKHFQGLQGNGNKASFR